MWTITKHLFEKDNTVRFGVLVFWIRIMFIYNDPDPDYEDPQIVNDAFSIPVLVRMKLNNRNF